MPNSQLRAVLNEALPPPSNFADFADNPRRSFSTWSKVIESPNKLSVLHFLARVRPTRRKSPHFWVACKKNMYGLTPLTASCGYDRPHWSLAYLVLTKDHTLGEQQRKTTAQKSPHENTLPPRVCTVCALRTGQRALILGRVQTVCVRTHTIDCCW